jgi:hypothetical protein
MRYLGIFPEERPQLSHLIQQISLMSVYTPIIPK